ncbi:MAG: YceI-like domain protein [Verrucomicrobia bacterium ADurb.Bin118]|jgi:polyisoprenoid-binding protein YceI|nr:MAG: YceI-like domain protein [Verrucomicrobia bacterium ADurb.Bin118]
MNDETIFASGCSATFESKQRTMNMKTVTRQTFNRCISRTWFQALCLGGLLGCLAQAAAEPIHYFTRPGAGKVKIEGTSSIHAWTMESPVIGGSVEAADGFPEAALKDEAAAKPKVKVIIPVRTLKSYNKRMDEVYQEHMEEPKFKNMEFALTELKPKGEAPQDGKCGFDAVGKLTVHGVTQTITMPVTIEKSEVETAGKKVSQLKIVGEFTLKMSDYGVQPPNPNIAGMGQITTGDEIKGTFEWSPRQK